VDPEHKKRTFDSFAAADSIASTWPACGGRVGTSGTNSLVGNLVDPRVAPLLFVSVAFTGLRHPVSSLDATLMDSFVSVDFKGG
jgi:hypothetical protein